MYIPGHFHETRTEVMHDLIRAHPLATIITVSSSGIEANHIPMHLCPGDGPFGTLRAHVARANNLWRATAPDVETLAIFQGPDGYISPSWYPGKQVHGKVVPTWNYAVVHAYGMLRIIDDPVWVLDHLQQLSHQHEAGFPSPWSVDDAPSEFIEKLLVSVVGVEFVITRMSGKWKASQNQPPENQNGIITALNRRGQNGDMEMAALISEARHRALKD